MEYTIKFKCGNALSKEVDRLFKTNIRAKSVLGFNEIYYTIENGNLLRYFLKQHNIKPIKESKQ